MTSTGTAQFNRARITTCLSAFVELTFALRLDGALHVGMSPLSVAHDATIWARRTDDPFYAFVHVK